MGKKGGWGGLSKAIKSNNCQPLPAAARERATVLDARSAAATHCFTVEELGLNKAGQKASTKTGMKTVLGAESAINVDRRVRNAAVPIGVRVADDAGIEEALTLDDFDVSRTTRHLMPRRPDWTFELSSGRLHHREVEAFKKWLEEVAKLIAERGGYPPAFEKNLQVWRQLWRLLERCDVAVVIVDARHPLLHLPPALVYHVSRTLRKPLVIVLNKLDSVQPADAERWADVLLQGVPGVSAVVGYSKESIRESDFGTLSVGKAALIEACHRVYDDARSSTDHRGAVASDAAPALAAPTDPAISSENPENPNASQGRIILGLVGHPNVGKSSLVNSMFGGKVVSVKATPGHTKTLQTLILDDRTCLCDGPGVVFPRLEVPREAQIIGMLIPIAQVREPFSSLRWVMDRSTTPLQETLGLKPVTVQQVFDLKEQGTDALELNDITVEDGDYVPWSPMLLCARYAQHRGLVQRGKIDCHKAGIELLERVLEGKVPYRVLPPTSVTKREIDDAGDNSDFGWEDLEADYESEKEEDKMPAEAGLFEIYGVELKDIGSRSIGSRKKAVRRQKLEAMAEGRVPPTKAELKEQDDQIFKKTGGPIRPVEWRQEKGEREDYEITMDEVD